MLIASLIAATVLALVHIWGVRLTFSPAVPRSHWLSMAGGTAVALVFLHILPELDRGQEAIDASERFTLEYIERHVYIVAMFGMVVFYGLELAVRVHYPGSEEEPRGTEHHMFWVHIGAFTIYNAIIGYLLLQRELQDILELAVFTLAIMLHFIVNDHALREHHRKAYHDVGRWLLAAAVFAGWGAAQVLDIGDALVGVLFAFIAGAIILNVLKEELPDERESKFWAFALGAIAYALLLIAVE